MKRIQEASMLGERRGPPDVGVFSRWAGTLWHRGGVRGAHLSFGPGGHLAGPVVTSPAPVVTSPVLPMPTLAVTWSVLALAPLVPLA